MAQSSQRNRHHWLASSTSQFTCIIVLHSNVNRQRSPNLPGGGILHPLLMAQHVEYMPVAQRGRAVATFYLGFDLGNGIGAWLLGVVLQLWGLTPLFALAALVSALGILLVGYGARKDAAQTELVV